MQRMPDTRWQERMIKGKPGGERLSGRVKLKWLYMLRMSSGKTG